MTNWTHESEYIDIHPGYKNKYQYVYDCKKKKEDPTVIVKWCRRNFGERGIGWDFLFTSGNVTIIVWDDKFKVMYEMWYN